MIRKLCFSHQHGISLNPLISKPFKLFELSEHINHIVPVDCIVINFMDIYCNQHIPKLKDFKFLNDFKTELDLTVVVVDLVFGPWIEYEDYKNFINIIKQHIPHAIFVTGDFKHRYNTDYIFYSGIFYYQQQEWVNEVNRGLDIAKITSRDYYISCLNRRPLNHRAYLITKLYNQRFINNKNYITFYNKNPYTNKLISKDDYYVSNLPEPVKEQFIELIPKLPFNHDADYQGVNDTSFDHQSFTNSYLNIVTESEIECRWLSEKVMKPLACGQMFLLAAGAGSVNDLRSLGFDMFDDIIDHDYYDTVEAWPERLDKILELVYKLENLNWPLVYQSTVDRRQNNIKRFHSKEFTELITRNLIQSLTPA